MASKNKIIENVKKDIKNAINVQDKGKLLRRNIPYLAFFFLGNMFSAHVRAYRGGDIFDRIFQAILELGDMSIVPSLNLYDVLTGAIFAGGIKAIIYFKGKNAKKFRQGQEYGSAR